MKSFVLVICYVLILRIDEISLVKELHFQIRIEESAILMKTEYVITNNKITISEYNPIEDEYRTYLVKLSNSEKASIMKSVIKIKLGALKYDYSGCSNADCDLDYKITFNIDSETKDVRIYKCKVESIYQFVKQVNLILSPEQEIGYKGNYFDD